MKRRCLDCPALISKGSRCQPCENTNRGTWRQRAAFRAAVLMHDRFTCQRCGLVDITGNQLEADHMIELREGGSDDTSNGQALCKACHREKTYRRTG